MIERIKNLFSFDEDSASEEEVIQSIERGVNFRGAKLWILIIAIFVASLGLNTNSAAVIIGAMLISPLMGPIIGMGLGIGIYDFELVRRSFRNYFVATLVSILTAVVYFFITPFNEAQSELLARTSPTIFDVLIALCGGLAGIIAVSSKSQRTGNVIPGVAIATALMPPLCTVGFGISTGNWAYAAGAFYLFFINTIFIAFATMIGARFIMQFEKKSYMDHSHEKKTRKIIYLIVFFTMIPSVWLTFGMVRKNYFDQNISKFIHHELHFPMTQVVSHHNDFENRAFSVVLIGNELDSTTIEIARERLSFYNLEGVSMKVIQGRQKAQGNEDFKELLLADSQELHHAETIIDQQQARISELDARIKDYEANDLLSPQLLKELKLLFPQVAGFTLARGTTAISDSSYTQIVALVSIIEGNNTSGTAEIDRLSTWLRERTQEERLKIIFDYTEEETAADNQ